MLQELFFSDLLILRHLHEQMTRHHLYSMAFSCYWGQMCTIIALSQHNISPQHLWYVQKPSWITDCQKDTPKGLFSCEDEEVKFLIWLRHNSSEIRAGAHDGTKQQWRQHNEITEKRKPVCGLRERLLHRLLRMTHCSQLRVTWANQWSSHGTARPDN
jgi:hypothetical protein